MWNEAEKNEAISRINNAWTDIHQVCAEYNFDDTYEEYSVDRALNTLLKIFNDTPVSKPKSERPMTTIRVDTHGMDAAAVQTALDAYVQDAVDKNLQDKS